jgi:uncharacterized protein
MRTKTMPAVYAPPEADEAGFTAIVSVFNNKDWHGDVVRPGAFTDTIAAWKNSGDPLPVYWSHRLDDPDFNIGAVTDMAELTPGDPRIPEFASEHVKANGGLWVKATLDDFGRGRQVRHLLTQRRVTQFSYTYDVESEQKSKDGSANELLKVRVHEVGPTPLGANELTELVGAKAQPDPPDDPPSAQDIPAKRRPSALFLCNPAVRRIELDALLADYRQEG